MEAGRGDRAAPRGQGGHVAAFESVRPLHADLGALAERLGVAVEAERRLFEGEPFEPVLDALGEVGTGAVLCSHGDIIPDVIQALVRRGMEVQTEPDWRKGSIWVLKRKGDRITKGKVWPPPS